MKGIICLFLFVCLCGCTSNYEIQSRARSLLSQQKPQDALNVVRGESSYYTDDSSLVVRQMDMGMLHYRNGHYYQALQHFDKASALSAEYYTSSLSRSFMSGLLSKNYTDYRGESYERSLLLFYQSLSHYQISLNGTYESYTDEEKTNVPEKTLSNPEKRRHMDAARAAILEWDSLQNTLYHENAGKDKFKTDLMAKTWGGFIHETYNSSNDRQIAKQLYKDATKVLLQNYNIYPSYNFKSEIFAEKYKDLPGMSVQKIEKEYISPTENARQLKQYAKNALDKMGSATPDNVKIVLKTDLIACKKAKKVSYDIPLYLLLGAGQSDSKFREFIFSVMPGQRISFEMEEFEKPTLSPGYSVRIKNKSGKIVQKKEFVLTEPVSEIAYHDNKRSQTAVYTETAARLAAKHAAALWTAYQVYDKEKSDSWVWARLAYTLEARGIEASEKADLRYWGTLPGNIWMQSLFLPAGDYTMEITQNNKEIFQKEFSVKKGIPAFLDINL